MRRIALGVALLVSLVRCGGEHDSDTDSDGHDTHADAAAPAAAVDVVELSATDARARILAGTLTSHALTQAYLDRIAAIDDAGPRLNAVIDLNPDALEEADALDAALKDGPRGPLHGLPVLIKDNIDVAGMINSAGSLAMLENRPAADAPLVAALRASGAVILGRTNLSEWANFRSTRSTSGWSSRGGQTKNPYALDRNPCGSSSGTGAAMAASLASLGVGTETDGSIICPAAVNGVVGLKPTLGLVSGEGIIPLGASQDCAGPMGRSVADVALMLGAMSDGKDYTAALTDAALAGKRIGVLRQSMGFHPDVDAAMTTAIATLQVAGAEVVDVTIATYGKWDPHELDVLLYEFKDGLNAYLARAGSTDTLESLIAWNASHPSQAMPYFGQERFEQAQAKGKLTDAAYLKARAAARRLAGKEGLLATLDSMKLDAIVAPSASPAWPIDHVNGDHVTGAGYSIAAVAGTPSLSVPAGQSHGLPIGIVFMGRANGEAELLAIGHAFEQATRARKAPEYRASIE